MEYIKLSYHHLNFEDTPLEKFAQLVDYHKTFETVVPHV